MANSRHDIVAILYCSLLLIISVLNCHAQNQNDYSVPTKHHNKIDDITNGRQIESLLVSIDKKYKTFKVDNDLKFKGECKKLCDSLKIVPFTKTDFDKNGYTDLLVLGDWYNEPTVLCILDSGKKKPAVIRLTRSFSGDCFFPLVQVIDNETFIDYFFFRQSDDWRKVDTSEVIEHKKLIFKFGDFVEFNRSPLDNKIQKIEYETTMCFGTCPVFKMTIKSDRSAIYEPIKFNPEDESRYNGRIDKTAYDELVGLLNYIDFPILESDYSVGVTDQQTCILKITYDNGKVKSIRDYGLLGTYGLNRLYEIIFSLRSSQIWN